MFILSKYLQFLLLSTLFFIYALKILFIIINYQNCFALKNYMKFKLYITKDGEQAIRNFKYKGGSSSWSYQYVFSPFAEYVLNFVPIHWAPNAITLAGFILVIIGWLVIWGIGNLGDPISPLRLIIFSICISVYTLLDNLDGKQSRRTKTSSPLGMLFDHGCDSMSCFLISTAVVRMIGIKDETILLFGLFLGVILTFYMSVWTQYYSQGVMLLGKINGVDDGIPMIYLLGLFTAFVGVQYWNEVSFFGVQRKYLLMNSVFFSSFLQIMSLFFNSSETFTKDVYGAVKKLFHIVCITITIFIITQFTDWHKLQNYYTPILFSLGIMFVRDITYLQLCVVTEQPYNQFITANSVFIFGYPLYILTHQYLGLNLIPLNVFIYSMLIFFILNYLNFVLSIIINMSQILGIKVFSIRDQLQKQKIKRN